MTKLIDLDRLITLWALVLAAVVAFPAAAGATITRVEFSSLAGLTIDQEQEHPTSANDITNRSILSLRFEEASPPDAAGLIVVREDGGSTILPAGTTCSQRSQSEVACPNPNQGKIRIFTGRGNDAVNLSALVPIPPHKFVPAEIDGGGGSDSLVGTAGPDTLNGDGRNGAGSPPVAETADALAGDDVLRGEAGSDTLLGEGGSDGLLGSQPSGGPATEHNVLDGGPGADAFLLGPSIGADEVRGGEPSPPSTEHVSTQVAASLGITTTVTMLGDLATYETRVFPSAGTAGVTVGLDAGLDGAAGEGDLIGGDVESVRGSARDDTITGDGDANVLEGLLGKDRLVGKAGDDTLRLVDGVADACPDAGSGTNTVLADLVDQPVFLACTSPPAVPTPKAKNFPSSIFLAVDETTKPAVVGGRLRVNGTRVRVPLRCPRSPQAACAGTLSISPARSRKAIAKVTYRVRARRSGFVTLRVGRAGLAKLRRSGGAVLTLVERGHSKKGPKTVEVARRLPPLPR